MILENYNIDNRYLLSRYETRVVDNLNKLIIVYYLTKKPNIILGKVSVSVYITYDIREHKNQYHL